MRTIRRVTFILVLAVCLVSPVAFSVSMVGLSPAQLYSFYTIGDSTVAWVCHCNFSSAETEWFGPYTDTPVFTLTFTHSYSVWYGIYTYDADTARYERAYYYYNQIL